MEYFITAEQCRRLAALPADARLRLLRAAIAVAIIRLALSLMPFRRVRASVEALKPGVRPPGEDSASEWVWAVRVVARRIPGASCLTQALALQWLLARAGRSATIYIGVAKHGARGFEAHAWLESGGETLIGGDESLERFAPILRLPTDAA